MPITKDHVLEVLEDGWLRNVNFTVGPIKVNWTEYGKVADYIASGLVTVTPGKSRVAMYIPTENTLKTRQGEPPLSLGDRANVVHESTHIISDANKVKVTRLADEVAAYLAQYTYHRLRDPSLEGMLAVGGFNSRFNLEKLCINLVKKYKLDKPDGRGAVISPADIQDLAKAVQADPEYSAISETEKLDADGISVPESTGFGPMKKAVFHDFYRRQLGRLVIENMPRSDEQVSIKVRSTSHENYVTYDPELLGLFTQFKQGGDTQKGTAQSKLVRIFLTIDQRSANSLRQRLSPARRGDVVSEQFQKVFPASVRSMLLDALIVER